MFKRHTYYRIYYIPKDIFFCNFNDLGLMIVFLQTDEVPEFGAKYIFTLKDAVTDCPEWLVQLSTLKRYALHLFVNLLYTRACVCVFCVCLCVFVCVCFLCLFVVVFVRLCLCLWVYLCLCMRVLGCMSARVSMIFICSILSNMLCHQHRLAAAHGLEFVEACPFHQYYSDRAQVSMKI